MCDNYVMVINFCVLLFPLCRCPWRQLFDFGVHWHGVLNYILYYIHVDSRITFVGYWSNWITLGTRTNTKNCSLYLS